MSKKIKLSFSIILVTALVSGYFLWQINKHSKVADKVPNEQEVADKVSNEREVADKVPNGQEVRFIGDKQVRVFFMGYNAPAETFDINFTPGRSYNVVVGGENGKRGLFITPLRIYQDSYCYLQTELYGNPGTIYMADIRGDGRTDLVVLLNTGSSGTTVDFRIIGDNGNGIGILADLSTLKESIRAPTGATIVDLSGKVGIEYKRAGTWPAYRVDIVWDQKKKIYCG